MRLVLWISVWLRRLVLLAILCLIGLAVPIGYTEYACRAPDTGRPAPTALDSTGRAYAELPGYVAAAAERDYAATIAAGDPHDFAFLAPVKAYWGAACAAVRGDGDTGGLPGSTRMAIYGEGAGFTARFMAKAAYEETLGRIATMVRGETRAPLDDLSAEQERDYAARATARPPEGWDPVAAAEELVAERGDSPRDWERMIALNVEYRTRDLLGRVLRLPQLPPEPAKLRAAVAGVDPAALAGIETVSVLGPRSGGYQIETAPGDAAIAPLTAIARAGGTFTDISGAGRVLLLVDAPASDDLGALVTLPRPDGESGHVLALPVAELAPALVRFSEGPARAARLLGN